jgi:hypothetical protein
MQSAADIGPAIAATVLHAQRAGARGADIASGLSTSERSNLTQANQRASAIVTALRRAT